jgi:hypothetical protein
VALLVIVVIVEPERSNRHPGDQLTVAQKAKEQSVSAWVLMDGDLVEMYGMARRGCWGKFAVYSYTYSTNKMVCPSPPNIEYSGGDG